MLKLSDSEVCICSL